VSHDLGVVPSDPRSKASSATSSASPNQGSATYSGSSKAAVAPTTIAVHALANVRAGVPGENPPGQHPLKPPLALVQLCVKPLPLPTVLPLLLFPGYVAAEPLPPTSNGASRPRRDAAWPWQPSIGSVEGGRPVSPQPVPTPLTTGPLPLYPPPGEDPLRAPPQAPCRARPSQREEFLASPQKERLP
jgi:hypothetical protein